MTYDKIIDYLLQEADHEDESADKCAAMSYAAGVIEFTYGAKLLRRIVKDLQSMSGE